MNTPDFQPTILITGGTGFAGSHLVEHLLDFGYTDIHVTTMGTKRDLSSTSALPADHIHQLDLLDKAAVETLIKRLKPDQLYHLAAMSEVASSFEQAEKTFLNNVLLQLYLLEALRAFSPETRILVVGTGQEYDVLSTDFQANPHPLTESEPLGPNNPYAVSKVTQDLLGLGFFYSYQLPVIRVRPFNHIGERQSPQFAVSHFAKQIAEAEVGASNTIKVGNLKAVRDFTDVKDIVRAYRIVMEEGKVGEVYNIGSAQGYTLQEILDQLIGLAKVEIKISHDSKLFRPVDMPFIIADNTKIRNLGWEPSIPLAETIARVLEYWRHHP